MREMLRKIWAFLRKEAIWLSLGCDYLVLGDYADFIDREEFFGQDEPKKGEKKEKKKEKKEEKRKTINLF